MSLPGFRSIFFDETLVALNCLVTVPTELTTVAQHCFNIDPALHQHLFKVLH